MRILEPLKNQSESWKSPVNLFLKKGAKPGHISNVQLSGRLETEHLIVKSVKGVNLYTMGGGAGGKVLECEY